MFIFSFIYYLLNMFRISESQFIYYLLNMFRISESQMGLEDNHEWQNDFHYAEGRGCVCAHCKTVLLTRHEL
jgi:hypothetical protein